MKCNIRVFSVCAVFVLIAVLSLSFFAGSSWTKADAGCQNFPETGHQVCGKFLDYWNSHGGLAQQGYPVSEVFSERNQDPPAGDGKVHNVQYFQRARFEEHLESSTNPVQLGLLGSEQFGAKYSKNTPPPVTNQLLTVTDKQVVQSIGSSTPKSGYVYLVVTIQLTNITSKEVDTNPLFFSVKTTANFSYDVTLVTGVDRELTLQKLQPGDTAAGKVVFEIPSSETPKSITFDDFTNNVRVSLQ